MDTLNIDDPLAGLSSVRKSFLLVLFCLSNFLDFFNNSALFSAIPAMSASIGLNNSQSVWLTSAYQLSFAAFLLISGRMSDIYNPKLVFLFGVYLVGSLSLIIGFLRNKIWIIVLRALYGIGAALSIPSALRMLVHAFPEPIAQAKVIAVFSAAGAFGNIIGIIIGALFVSYASWPWIFYSAAIMAFFISVICTFLIPRPRPPEVKYSHLEQLKRLDVPGGSMIIAALVLFIFAMTSGSIDGWKTATVLVPLFLSIILFVLFFTWEARIPEEHASLPPRLWSYPNFGPLMFLALLPYAWWTTLYLIFSWYWQEVLHWSAIISAVHFLPIGVCAFPFMALASILQQKFEPKFILLGCLALVMAGSIFLPFAEGADRYWPVVFPAFLLGTAGATIIFATTSIGLFTATPPAIAGTVGAIFSCALQIGNAVVSPVATSIQTSVQPSPTSFKGRAAAFEFVIAVVGVEIISVLVFVRKMGVLSQSRTSAGAPEGHVSASASQAALL